MKFISQERVLWTGLGTHTHCYLKLLENRQLTKIKQNKIQIENKDYLELYYGEFQNLKDHL